MICQQCHEREATYHITETTDQAERRTDLCEACCRESRPEFLEPPMLQEGYSCTIVTRDSKGSGDRDMAHVQRSVVTLRIGGDDLVPDEITKLLGAKPTAAETKGE